MDSAEAEKLIKETAFQCEKSIRKVVYEELAAKMICDYDRKLQEQRMMLNSELNMFQDQIIRDVKNSLGEQTLDLENAVAEI